LVINLFGKYPLGNTRTSLFLAPNFILLFVVGTQNVADFLVQVVKYPFKNFQYTSTLRKSFGFILSFMVIMTTFIRANGNPEPFLKINEVEDVKGAMNYLADKSTADDILYVHASMREQFVLYSRVYTIQARKVLYGDFGWPCCTRNDSTGLSGEINAFEISKIKTQKENNKVRLLFTGRIGHWNYVGRSDPDMLHDKLVLQGCKRDSSTTEFRKIIIDEYTCK
jgi:hypothetical protein